MFIEVGFLSVAFMVSTLLVQACVFILDKIFYFDESAMVVAVILFGVPLGATVVACLAKIMYQN